MKLKSIKIEIIPSWKDNAGKYEAEIEYEGKRGEVKLLLDTQVSEALLLCIGQTVTEFAHRTAKQLERDIEQSVLEARQSPAIEAKTEAA